LIHFYKRLQQFQYGGERQVEGDAAELKVLQR